MEVSQQFAAVYTPPGSDLMERACPTPEDVPFFNHCMHVAKDMGLAWEEALQYVIGQRGD